MHMGAATLQLSMRCVYSHAPVIDVKNSRSNTLHSCLARPGSCARQDDVLPPAGSTAQPNGTGTAISIPAHQERAANFILDAVHLITNLANPPGSSIYYTGVFQNRDRLTDRLRRWTIQSRSRRRQSWQPLLPLFVLLLPLFMVVIIAAAALADPRRTNATHTWRPIGRWAPQFCHHRRDGSPGTGYVSHIGYTAWGSRPMRRLSDGQRALVGAGAKVGISAAWAHEQKVLSYVCLCPGVSSHAWWTKLEDGDNEGQNG